MNTGFTGTRHGMTDKQREAFDMLVFMLSPTKFSHGDCIGSDDEAVTIVKEKLGCKVKIVCHAPVDSEHRAWNKYHDELRDPKTYLARNRDIVNENDVLIATPCEMEHQPRGGTWYTIDYATKKGKKVYIIYPDGTIGVI